MYKIKIYEVEPQNDVDVCDEYFYDRAEALETAQNREADLGYVTVTGYEFELDLEEKFKGSAQELVKSIFDGDIILKDFNGCTFGSPQIFAADYYIADKRFDFLREEPEDEEAIRSMPLLKLDKPVLCSVDDGDVTPKVKLYCENGSVTQYELFSNADAWDYYWFSANGVDSKGNKYTTFWERGCDDEPLSAHEMYLPDYILNERGENVTNRFCYFYTNTTRGAAFRFNIEY